jgi:competence protein ComEC
MNQTNWIKRVFIVIGALLFINFVVLGYLLFLRQPVPANDIRTNDLRVIFLNVGQGDATLIQSPSQKNILIDGGPDRQIIYKLDQYIPLTRRQIDLMILTHPDPDHLNGLVEVLKRYRVSQVAHNGVSDPDRKSVV